MGHISIRFTGNNSRGVIGTFKSVSSGDVFTEVHSLLSTKEILHSAVITCTLAFRRSCPDNLGSRLVLLLVTVDILLFLLLERNTRKSTIHFFGMCTTYYAVNIILFYKNLLVDNTVIFSRVECSVKNHCAYRLILGSSGSEFFKEI
jgi:hypothetical protein